jgi:hypothetical protein
MTEPETPEALLAEARAAWCQMVNEEANMRRLNAYRQLSRSMRRDATQSAVNARVARETLHRILGPQA